MKQRTTSRLTSKSRTTIPRAVRDKLALQPGDTIVYEIDEDAVRLRREAALDLTWLRAQGYARRVGVARRPPPRARIGRRRAADA